MSALDRGDEGVVALAREALATSQAMESATATVLEALGNVGRLEYSVESLLLVIDKLTERP